MANVSKTRALAHAVVASGFLLVLTGSVFSAEIKIAAIAPAGGEIKSTKAIPFSLAAVHFEHNATDGDVEVVFEVRGGTDGLAGLIVRSPDGRRVIAFGAPDASTMGIRQFRFESPEPRDVKSIKAAYPEGVYKFFGKTASGAKFFGKSTLSHRLPAATALAKPAATAENVSVKDFEVSWIAVQDTTSYIVKIEQRDLNVNLAALLPGSTTSFTVPNGFLSRGTKYQLSIGTVSRERNMSFVQTTFTTEQ